jgi:hypothetical protein
MRLAALILIVAMSVHGSVIEKILRANQIAPLTGACSEFATANGPSSDFIYDWAPMSQSFCVNADHFICGFSFDVAFVSSTSSHVEIRTAPNGGGTLLATSSSVPTVSGWNSYSFYPPVGYAANTTVYVTYVCDSVDSLSLQSGSCATGQSYNGATAISGETLKFELDTLQ